MWIWMESFISTASLDFTIRAASVWQVGLLNRRLSPFIFVRCFTTEHVLQLEVSVSIVLFCYILCLQNVTS